MLKQFYEKALPSQGVYCVTGIDQASKKTTNRFAETLDDVFKQIEKIKKQGSNTYVALGSFDGFSRKADNALFYRSFFIDLDCGEDKAISGKGYANKDDALTALDKFLEESELPPPVIVDSGTGIHAYWILEEDVPIAEYLPYAEKFKTYVLARIKADPAVMADVARIMRCPDTLNYKTDPPSESKILSSEIHTYSFDAFKEFLGEAELSPDDVLAHVKKGLDEETRKALNMDNFKYVFAEIADKSVNGTGCNQIRYMLEEPNAVSRNLWAGGLTIAVHCEDGATAIHQMSEDYKKYSYDETEKTAHSFNAPRTCDWFNKEDPSKCEGCIHRGRIKTPIVLGKEFQAAATTSKEDAVWEVPSTEEIPTFPDFLRPFVRGAHGGIYFTPPPKVDKKGVVHNQQPIQILPHDLYPVQRLYSTLDGECLTMRLMLPNDGRREFLLPMKHVYAQEEFKKIMISNGVMPQTDHVPHLMNYVIKWEQYMISFQKAEMMRMQMGWTEPKFDGKWHERSFVIGSNEVTIDGKVIKSAASPMVRMISRHLKPIGTLEKWKAAAQELNRPQLEVHAFGMLCGFGSPLMEYMSTSGVTLCLTGGSGNAKTGAMYAGLSVFGNPKELSIFDATDNGMTGRYLGLHNLMLGIDEISNKDGKILSQLVHKISHGKAKIRMQASTNAEREYEASAALIAFLTSNRSIYGKLEAEYANPDGEAARVVEFMVKKPDILQGNMGGTLGRQIFDTFRTNFGHAGIPYIQEMLRLGDNYIEDRIGFWRNKFVTDFGNDNTYRFYENLATAAMVGGDLATSANLITLDLDRIYNDTVNRMINVRDNVIRVNKVDYESILGDFMNINIPNTLVIKDGRMTYEPKGQLVARCVSEESLYQVSKTKFKEYLQLKHINVSEFEDYMKQKNILIDTKKVRLSSGWKSTGGAENVWAYNFKSSLPDTMYAADGDN
jgi:hypothetical protein